MNIVWAILITAAVAAVAVAALLLVRRGAPEGGYFEDGDRAAGVFGVLATGFSVLLGFIVFLAFASYDQSRAGAEQEALILVQQVENAQFFPQAARGQLTSELVCYGRSVVNDEWARMTAGTQGDAINPWGVKLFRTLQTVQPQSATEQSAYDKWLEQTSAREEARRDRIHGAAGVIPIQLWFVLFFIAIVIFVFMLFFADSGERAIVQGMLIGSVVSVITVLLLLLNGLNSPFHDGVGGLQPVAMERSLRVIDEALGAVGAEVELALRRGRDSGVAVSAGAAVATESSSSPRCCSPWQRLPLRGAATSRPDGTVSRQRPAHAPTRCGSSRPSWQGSQTLRRSSTCRSSRIG